MEHNKEIKIRKLKIFLILRLEILFYYKLYSFDFIFHIYVSFIFI
jgi:hypothetical protein